MTMEKKSVRVGGCTLGEGMAKICVPVMGDTARAMAAHAARAREAGADLIELRIDSLSAEPSSEEAVAACHAVRAAGLPVLFTMRTARDGGPGTAALPAYEALLAAVIEAGCCDAVDIELSVGEAAFARLAALAHAHGVPVVGSSHEFGELGDPVRAHDWLTAQHALGADVCKAAVMARSRSEAFAGAWQMARAGEEIAAPVIAIVMGPYGLFTRAACENVGSCLTFAAAGAASAPGQMDAGTLRGVLEALHGA